MKKIILFLMLIGFLRSPIFGQIQVVQFDMGKQTITKVENQNLPGNDYRNFELKPGESCQACIDSCLKDPNCKGYTYVKPGVQGPNARCWLKSAVSTPVNDTKCISGVKQLPVQIPGQVMTTFRKATLNPDAFEDLKWSAQTGPLMKGGINLPGNDYASFFIPADQDQLPQTCLKAAMSDPKCDSWTYVEPGVQGTTARCWLKSSIPMSIRSDSCVSGIRLKPVYVPKEIPNLNQLDPEKAKASLDKFDKEWTSILSQSLGNMNQKVKQIQQQKEFKQKMMYEKLVLQQNTPRALPQPLPNPSCLIEINTKNQILTAKLKGQDISLDGLKQSKDLPLFRNVHAVITDPKIQKQTKEINTIYEGHYIIIYGKNFGPATDDCGIRIEYEIGNKEFMESERFSLDLEAYNNDWEKSWFDDYIVARVPRITSTIGGKGKLLIWRGGEKSFLIKQEVNIRSFGPGLQYIHWTPTFDEGHIASFSKISIAGSGFGQKTGTVEIGCTELNKRWKLKTTWGENLIEAVAPDFLLDTIYRAKFYVVDNEGDTAMELVKIGPRMTDVWISGSGYALLEIADNGGKDEGHTESKENHNFLAVTHDPTCGIEGNSGHDDFFARQKLDPHFTVTGCCFIPINSYGWEDGLNYGIKMLTIALSDPWVLGGVAIVAGLAYLINPEVGKYTTELIREPTIVFPFTQVHWHNTCWFLSPYFYFGKSNS